MKLWPPDRCGDRAPGQLIRRFHTNVSRLDSCAAAFRCTDTDRSVFRDAAVFARVPTGSDTNNNRNSEIMSFKTHLLSTTIASLMAGAAFAAGAQASSVGVAGAVSATPLMVDAQPQETPLQGGGSCNPCNPCAAKACNPCNPCAAKNACNPCNPCAAKNACNPCNPCAAKKNPCGSGADNPDASQASMDLVNMDAIPA